MTSRPGIFQAAGHRELADEEPAFGASSRRAQGLGGSVDVKKGAVKG
jgi:hypothetical protein